MAAEGYKTVWSGHLHFNNEICIVSIADYEEEETISSVLLILKCCLSESFQV